MTDPMPHEAPFVLATTPLRPQRRDNTDFYRPESDAPLPAIIFVHGMPFPDTMPLPRKWPVYIGYATHTAAKGVAGIVVDHAPKGRIDYEASAELVAQTVDAVRDDPAIDPQRIALWFFSGGGPLCSDYLREPPGWLRCVALTYPVLGEYRGPIPARFLPAAAVGGAAGLPIVLTRAGLDRPEIDATGAQFLSAAERAAVKVDTIEVPQGRHGFDMLDHTAESRAAVEQALSAVVGHLVA